MVVAMMLPTAYPVVALFRGVIRRRRDRVLLLALCVSGYLTVWVSFGAVVFVGDLGVHQLAERVAWVEQRPWMVGAAVLALAGGYQFSTLKYQCLNQCRSPRSFVVRCWTGRRERRLSFALGVASGMFCVGCCWSLMLLMFAVGTGNIAWMLTLGTVMAIEKNVSWGDRISGPLGAALLLAALATVTSGALG